MANELSIKAFPIPRPGDIFSGRRGSFAPELDRFDGLAGSGRGAMFRACRGLDRKQHAWAWLPAMHCGVEVEAILQAGYQVAFYSVANDLSVDEDDLERKIRRQPGLVVLIHYFGFPQPATRRIEALCSRHGCVLVEDCAHSLFSRSAGRQLGDFGHVAVFSLRKTLGLFDGGAFRVNREALHHVQEGAFESTRPGFSLQPYLDLSKQLLGRPLRQALQAFRSLPSRTAQENPEGPSRPDNRRMSLLSQRLASQTDEAALVEARRRNYLELEDRLRNTSGYEPLFSELPQETCPLFLPIWVSERTLLQNKLSEIGIETYRFGARAHDLLAQAHASDVLRHRNNILCLPVHQQLSARDIEFVAEAVEHHLPKHRLCGHAFPVSSGQHV